MMTPSEPPVADSSPLIVLARGGMLDPLRVVGPRVIVPSAVAAEVRQHGGSDPAARALDTLGWLQIRDVGGVDSRVRAHGLGPGESEALTWALRHAGAAVIVDDRAARRAAEDLGIAVRGILGIVLAAKHQGVIPAARPVVDHLLHTTDWYLSASERDRALRRVGE
ncbi:MAG: DUF3368 domain-containing protein [Chloroflexi bacterium]|nr:DUF3368 domain-containing protein [Chloroflexota bacterium]